MRKPRHSQALGHFVWGSHIPPYEITVGEEDQTPLAYTLIDPQDVLVVPAACKTGWAASRHNMIRHAVYDAAAVLIDGKVYYAARWMCRASKGSHDAVFVRPDAAVAVCRVCVVIKDITTGPGAYRLFGADDDLLYIGSAEDVQQRLAVHLASKKRRGQIARVEVTPYPTVAEARAAETLAIRTERPRLNIAHVEAGAA